MENSCRCEFCTIDFHRESYAKHLRSKKHLEITKQDDIVIPEWLFKKEQARIKVNVTLKH